MTATRPTRLAAAVLVATAAVVWACALVAAPIVAASDGSVPFAWGAALAYRAGSAICHQQDGRSLHVAGLRMPVCARCAGLYAGGALGALAALAWAIGSAGALRLPLGRARAAAVACGLPTLGAWAAEHLAGLPVSALARAALALPLGAAVAAIITLWAGGAAFDDNAPGSALH
jgi:hypothetical protein